MDELTQATQTLVRQALASRREAMAAEQRYSDAVAGREAAQAAEQASKEAAIGARQTSLADAGVAVDAVRKELGL